MPADDLDRRCPPHALRATVLAALAALDDDLAAALAAALAAVLADLAAALADLAALAAVSRPLNTVAATIAVAAPTNIAAPTNAAKDIDPVWNVRVPLCSVIG